MGASLVYLDEPNKNIEWAEGEDSHATFACGEMQGWRLNMVSELARSVLLMARTFGPQIEGQSDCFLERLWSVALSALM